MAPTGKRRRVVMDWTFRILACAVTIYAVLLVALYAVQRRLMYFPSRYRASVQALALSRAMSRDITTADGETIVA